MNNIFKIPAFQRRKAIPKQLKDLELLPLNEQFSKLTMSIVGDDDLRPVMTGNFFAMESKKIVSTDAHKLTAINMPKDTFNFIAQKYNKELDKEPKGLIFHTLSQLQKDYNKLMKNNNITISFDEFINDRAIEDGRYPNYEAVIPKEFTNEIYVDYSKLYWYAKVLLDAKVIDDVTKINTSNANEYQNKKIEYLKDSYVPFLPYTKQIILTYTLDGKQEYIGFNARLLCDLLKFAMEFNGKTFGLVGLSGNSRAMVIELENGLNVATDSIGIVMPVMLFSGQFDNTIGDSDFNNNVAMYYDLDTNSIISDKQNYPINESIGFMPNKANLSTPNIRVKEEVSKVENSSADLIDKKIRGLRIALKVAKQGTEQGDEKLIEKKIKGLEIAKRMKKDDLPFAKGGLIKEFNLREIKSLSIGNQKFLTDDINDKGYIYENGILYDVDYKDEAPHYKKGSSHRMSKIKVNIVNKMAKGGNVDEDISWDITIRDVYENEIFEINVRGYFENEEDAIKQAIKDYDIYVDESDYGQMYWNGNKITIYGAKKNYKKGGSIGFKGLSNKVASNYEGKKVPQRFQSIYGKTYSQSEAQEVGNKVAGKVYREQQANKMAYGGMVEFYDYKGVEIMYEPTYEEYFVNDLVFNSLEKAHKYIDSGEANKTPTYIENLYRRGAMAKGGKIEDTIGSYTDFKNKVVITANKRQNDNSYEVIVKRYPSGENIVEYPRTMNRVVFAKNYIDAIGKYTDGEIGVGTFTEWIKANSLDYNNLFDYAEKNNVIMPKYYAKGGSVDEQTYIDLFEDYENIPAEVQMILDEYSESFEDGDYIGMSKAQNELEQIGYTFDFYVDGDAYALRPTNVKLSQIQGYEDEDEE